MCGGVVSQVEQKPYCPGVVGCEVRNNFWACMVMGHLSVLCTEYGVGVGHRQD